MNSISRSGDRNTPPAAWKRNKTSSIEKLCHQRPQSCGIVEDFSSIIPSASGEFSDTIPVFVQRHTTFTIEVEETIFCKCKTSWKQATASLIEASTDAKSDRYFHLRHELEPLNQWDWHDKSTNVQEGKCNRLLDTIDRNTFHSLFHSSLFYVNVLVAFITLHTLQSRIPRTIMGRQQRLQLRKARRDYSTGVWSMMHIQPTWIGSTYVRRSPRTESSDKASSVVYTRPGFAHNTRQDIPNQLNTDTHKGRLWHTWAHDTFSLTNVFYFISSLTFSINMKSAMMTITFAAGAKAFVTPRYELDSPWFFSFSRCGFESARIDSCTMAVIGMMSVAGMQVMVPHRAVIRCSGRQWSTTGVCV